MPNISTVTKTSPISLIFINEKKKQVEISISGTTISGVPINAAQIGSKTKWFEL